MDKIITIVWITVVTITPFLLLRQFIILARRSTSKSANSRRVLLLRNFAGFMSILYVFSVAALWLYLWFIFTPDTSPTTSFSPTSQRLLGTIMYGSLAFLFVAPIVAASLAAFRDSFTKVRK